MQGKLRRELNEQKEAFYTTWLSDLVNRVIDYSSLASQEIHISLKVAYDDGNLPCAFTHAILDLLTQLTTSLLKASVHADPRPLLKESHFFTTMAMSVKGKLVLDPTFEEMFISNNLLAVTFFASGAQQIEKSLCFRTAQAASQV